MIWYGHFFVVLIPALLVLPLCITTTNKNADTASVFKKWHLKKNNNIRINRTVHVIGWVNNPPYLFIKKGGNETTGILPKAIESLFYDTGQKRLTLGTEVEKFLYNIHPHKSCFFNTEEQLIEKIEKKDLKELINYFNTTPASSDIFVLSGTTYASENTRLFQRVPTIYTKEAVLVVRTEDIIFLTRFLSSIWTCKGIIFFAATCAINLAALIWLIEFRSNPEFAKPFGKGLWDGIWFCFVTMTTVGYGDKYPRHFLSKVLCMVWMLFGLMLTGMITTIVMETTHRDFRVIGEKIGISNCTVQSALVSIKLSAVPVIYSTSEDVLRALRNEDIKAGLLDASVAAYLFKVGDIQDLKIESVVTMKIWLYSYIFQPKNDGVLFHKSKLTEYESENLRSEFVPSYVASRYYARDFVELYDVTSGMGLVTSLTVTAFILVFTGVLTELYLRFNHLMTGQRKRKMKRKLTEELHLVPVNTELEILKKFEMEFHRKLGSIRQKVSNLE